MSKKIQNIAKNTSFFTFALILQKFVSFTYFTILARYLGPEYLGQYFFAISFASIFGIIIDIGIANVLTREIAKNQEASSSLLANIIAIKIPLMILSWVLIFLFISILGYDGMLRSLILLSLVAVSLDSFTYTFFAVSRGHHNLIFESFSSVIFQLIVLGLGLYFLFFSYSLLFVMSALISASIFNFLYSSILLKSKWKINFFTKINFLTIKSILILTIPFGIFVAFQRLYLYLDSVLLKILAGDYYVGLYQIAFKIIFSLQFLPMAFTASLYPAMSTYWKSDKNQLLTTFERAFTYLLIISLPISFGIAFLSEQIIIIFSSKFTDAVIPLVVIIFSLPFIFLNFPIGSLLNAADKQKINTFNMGLALFSSIVLNILLIPRYQALGASLTVLLTNILFFALGMYQVPKIIKINFLKLRVIVYKTFFASLLMSSVVYILKIYLNIFFVVFISGIVYFVVLFLVRGFKKEDILSIFNSVVNKSS